MMNLFTLSRIALGFGLIAVGCATQLDDNNYQSPNVTEVASTVSPAMPAPVTADRCKHGARIVECPATNILDNGTLSCESPRNDGKFNLVCLCNSTGKASRITCEDLGAETNSDFEDCSYEHTRTEKRGLSEYDCGVFKSEKAYRAACNLYCNQAPLRAGQPVEISCCNPPPDAGPPNPPPTTTSTSSALLP